MSRPGRTPTTPPTQPSACTPKARPETATTHATVSSNRRGVGTVRTP